MLIQEEYFRNIFNTVREAILILDENMRVLSANRSFFRIFKVDSANTIGSLFYDLGNGQWNIPYLRVLLEDILPKNDTVDDYEIEHNFESIGHKTMLLNACKIREKNNDPPIILLAIEDITERRKLEESHCKLSAIVEFADDAIIGEDLEGIIAIWNGGAEIAYGYNAGEIVGKSISLLMPPARTDEYKEVLAKIARGETIKHYETQRRKKDGQIIDVSLTISPIKDTSGEITGASTIARDITERRQLEDLLTASEERYRRLFETASDGIVLLDKDEGKITHTNPAAEKMLGYSKEECIGKNLQDIGITLDMNDFPAIMQALDRNAIINYTDIQVKTKSGEHIYTDIYMVDRARLAQCNIRDVTDRRKLEGQLMQSQKMEAVGTLAGGIAHDFNNILNVIIGYGTMVMDTLDAGSPVKEQMSEVLIAADRAANLTKWLLVFSRKQVVDVKPVDVNEVLLGLQKMLVRIIRESTALNFDLAERPLIVLADAGQIEQVIINLAANARDAMQDGGRLTISTGIEEVDDDYVAAYGYGKPGRYALITVADTGQGMDAETRSKIFEPFFTTKGIGEGTGLGLAISYGIIKQHSGYIKVYSEPGQGTVFKIYLPLSSEAVSGYKMAEAVTVRGGNETVLVAEDDASLRKLTRIVLESFGYNVISSEDGEDAISKFMENRERISLVLLDMIMPKKNGKEVSEAIRKVSPRIKILFASGYPMINIKPKELAEADFDFINKPVLPKDLLIKVREILDREEISGPGQ